jgi:anti-anti-sigma factor
MLDQQILHRRTAMAAQPVIFAIGPYEDHARKIVAPASLLHGQEHFLLPLAMPAIEQGNLELDLSELEHIDAAGLGMLAVLHECARQFGHTLRLMNPTPHVCSLLRLTKLDAVFTEKLPEDSDRWESA